MGGRSARLRAATEEVVIWHNPRCSKSRQTLGLLQARGVNPRVREYLKDPPDTKEITRVLDLLGFEPRQLMRAGEARFTELGLDREDTSRADYIAAMAGNPILIQRPVVIRGNRAALGRPPANVASLFD